MIVIDASVAVAWSFHDESTPSIEAILFRVERDGASVPSNWRLEVANALRTAMRLGRIDDLDRNAIFNDLLALPIMVDEDTDAHAWIETVALSDKHGLTPYDAAYLELALRLAVPLAANDKQLARAARSEGLAVIP